MFIICIFGVKAIKVAVIASRGLTVKNLGKYLPKGTTEIVSGGARGIDSCAEMYAKQNGIPIKVFLPEYEKYGKTAPLKRNILIIDYADSVLAFWDGVSHGTKFVIDNCKKTNKPVKIYMSKPNKP